MKTVRVYAKVPYDVVVGHGVLASLGALLEARHRLCRAMLVCDSTVYALCGRMAEQSLVRSGFLVSCYRVSEDRPIQTLDGWMEVVTQMIRQELTRGDLLVVMGGSNTLRAVGFAAATYLGGIDYVQVPTTLRAATELSAGGLTGIQAPQGRDLIQADWQPAFVLCDCDMLDHLPAEMYEDGVAECLKYSVLADRALFERITSGALEEDPMNILVACLGIRIRLLGLDRRKTPNLPLLAFGETIARAVQSISAYTVRRGHALAIEMVGMARISEALGTAVMGCAGVLMAMLDRLNLPFETGFDAGMLARMVCGDRRREDDTVTLVLIESIGCCVPHTVEVHELLRLFHLAKGARL